MPLSRNGNFNRRRNALIPSGAFLGTVVLVALACVIGLLHFIAPSLVVQAAKPFWRLGAGATDALTTLTAPFNNSVDLTRQRDLLLTENLALNEDNRTLRAKVADLTQLTGSRTASAARILAGVLARPPVTRYDTLVIDRGSAQGVAVGAFVFGPGNVPLGTIASVTTASSNVELFSTGGRVTEGWVGEKRVPLSLTGKGAGAFEATMPRDSGVAVNDVVYVPGPGALPIGAVTRIDSDPSSPRDTVHVAPYANLFSLTWVEIAP